jgi:hypothetical protein
MLAWNGHLLRVSLAERPHGRVFLYEQMPVARNPSIWLHPFDVCCCCLQANCAKSCNKCDSLKFNVKKNKPTEALEALAKLKEMFGGEGR